jgi:hypothetical protein
MRTGKSFRISTSLGVLTMKIRVKPALRSRLLAAGVSLTSFAAMVLGFMQESQFTPPELSVKSAGTNNLLSSETPFAKDSNSTLGSESTPFPISSPSAQPTKSPNQSAVASSPNSSPSAQPTKSPNQSAVASSPNSSPSAQPTKTATPSVSPSIDPRESVEPATPSTPSTPASPDLNETPDEETTVIYTCMSPGGNTREPVGTPSCPGKWGYVLTQV